MGHHTYHHSIALYHIQLRKKDVILDVVSLDLLCHLTLRFEDLPAKGR